MNWVKDLREMGSEGAPVHVETRLRAAFRERAARRRTFWAPIAVAASVVLAVAGYWISRPVERVLPPPLLAARATPPQTAFAKGPRAPVRHSAIRNPHSAIQEVATDFFPLQYVADARVLGNGTVVRVSMPRAAMTTFGFPVEMERRQEQIQADVVLGGDGMARAIRFVQQRSAVAVQ